MKKIINTLLLLLLLGASSCVSQKKMAYVYGISAASADSINQNFHAQREAHIVCGDALIITVNALDLEAVETFNMPLYSPGQVGTDRVYSGYQLQYYTVDKNGCINFPTLGKIHVEGMTRNDLETYLTQEIGKDVKDPIVYVAFRNYKITVLGEVRNPRTYTMNSEKNTILQVLGQAGDLTLNALRNDILLIREVDGVLTHTKIDLRDSDILQSPYFFLQQNDIIIVQPSAVRVAAATTATGIWSVLLSSITTLIAVFRLF